MPNTRIVVARGAVDGVNVVFGVGEPYVPGSTAYVLNGRVHNQALARGPENDYGYVELDPGVGTIQVDNPLVDGDVVQIFYWDRKVAPAPPVQSITGVVGIGVAGQQRAQGVVADVVPQRLSGVVSTAGPQGVVRDARPGRLVGQVTSQRIVGVVKDRCP